MGDEGEGEGEKDPLYVRQSTSGALIPRRKAPPPKKKKMFLPRRITQKKRINSGKDGFLTILPLLIIEGGSFFSSILIWGKGVVVSAKSSLRVFFGVVLGDEVFSDRFFCTLRLRFFNSPSTISNISRM